MKELIWDTCKLELVPLAITDQTSLRSSSKHSNNILKVFWRASRMTSHGHCGTDCSRKPKPHSISSDNRMRRQLCQPTPICTAILIITECYWPQWAARAKFMSSRVTAKLGISTRRRGITFSRQEITTARTTCPCATPKPKDSRTRLSSNIEASLGRQ